MSFSSRISKFRDLVRTGSQYHATSEVIAYHPSSTSMPDLRKLDPNPVDVPCLHVAELDGDGARAIVLPDSSVFSSTFLGVNKAFCNLFGYDSCEFQSCPFTKLTGAITDTRQLQACGKWRSEDQTYPVALTSVTSRDASSP